MIDELKNNGIEFIRVSYPDLHGVCRGKDITLAHYADVAEHGMAQVEAIMTVDLGHNVVAGFETGFRDYLNVPDPATMVTLPWDPTTAWTLTDARWPDGSAYDACPRAALKRACAELAELGLGAVAAPELEFYLVDPETFKPYTPQVSAVYTAGHGADPDGIVREMTVTARELGLKPIASSHEYGCGQYEINLDHGEAVDAVDRSFRFKDVVKQIAARHGLLATFMGRPFDHDESSGLHLHVSLDRNGENAFADPGGEQGLSTIARQFAAGVLAHTPALTAFLNPTVNSYRRLVAESLAPTHINWGHDNRLALLRFPPERGRATRLEVRTGDGAANLYLAVAGILFAGLDGIRRELELGPPVVGNPYEHDALGEQLPSSLDDSLAGLEADAMLREAIGERLCQMFLTIKRYELDRWHAELAKVTDWERREYGFHL